MRRILVLATLAAMASAGVAHASVPGSSCPMFPSGNVWHASVATLPIHPRSAAWLASASASTKRLHPDFGGPYGIPFQVVPSSHQKVSVTFEYADESDPGPYPLGSDTPIEGGSDRHALVVDRGTCRLYETWNTQHTTSGWTAGSGAQWSLSSNALRPASWTSADAAGLPILPGLLRPDEVARGHVDHAIRFTVSRTDRSYVWPARHQAGAASDPSLPPMGARFRLKASYSTAGVRADTRAVLVAMKTYGLILADNGSDWFFQGSTSNAWPDALLDELKQVPASAFEAVDESSLMVSPNSAAVRSTTSAPAPSPTHKPTPTRRATTPPPSRTPSPTATPRRTTPPPPTVTPAPTTAAVAEPPVPEPRPGHRWWPWLLLLTGATGGTAAWAIRRRATRSL